LKGKKGGKTRETHQGREKEGGRGSELPAPSYFVKRKEGGKGGRTQNGTEALDFLRHAKGGGGGGERMQRGGETNLVSREGEKKGEKGVPNRGTSEGRGSQKEKKKRDGEQVNVLFLRRRKGGKKDRKERKF